MKIFMELNTILRKTTDTRKKYTLNKPEMK